MTRKPALYSIAALGLGAVLTAMSGLNSAFAARAGNLLSTLVVHLVGLAAVSALLLVRPEPRKGGHPAFYLYGAGVFGVLLVLGSNLCFRGLGASLTVSIYLFSQVAGSILTEATGFLGMGRHRFDPRRLGAVAMVLAGIAVMTEAGRPALPLVLLAFATGFFPLLCSLLNARLAAEVGVFRGVRINFLAGLGATLAAILVSGTELRGAPALIATVPLPVLAGGGLLSVLAVGGLNVVFPRLPTLRATLLLFLGQLAAGLAVDAVVLGAVNPRKAIGAAIVVAGLLLDAAVEAQAAAPRAA